MGRWQIIDTVDVALSGIPVSIPLGYLIAEIFAQLFVIAGETAIVYCIFGFLFSRLHDSARLGKGVRIAGISATALLGALVCSNPSRSLNSIRPSFHMDLCKYLRIVSSQLGGSSSQPVHNMDRELTGRRRRYILISTNSVVSSPCHDF